MSKEKLFPINAIINDDGSIVVQTPKPIFRHLALAGCGVKGTGYAGLVKVLKQHGLLDDIENVAGTSAGAIAALIISLGYTPDEIYRLLCDLPMAKFLEGNHSWSITPEILRKGWKALVILLKQKHALSSGTEFIKWLEAVVAKKLGKPDATFEDLENKIKEMKKEGKDTLFKHLFVTATNISLETPESKTFSADTTPKVPLAKAVAASGAFPFVFPPVEIDGYLYSDGGLIKNLPACIFDARKFLPEGYEFNDQAVNPATIAVEINSESEIAQIIWGASKQISLNSASEITYAIYNALSQTVDITKIREARTVIALPDGKVQTLQFSIDEQGKLDLISATEQATQVFLENHAGELYSVQTYKNVEQWLESLSIDEIDDLKIAYEKKLEQWKSQQLSEIQDNVGLKKMDPDNPTKEQLIEYLKFLDKYEDYRKKVKRYQEQQKELLNKMKEQSSADLFAKDDKDEVKEKLAKPEIKFPDFHINLKLPKMSEQSWDAHVIKEMETRLKSINNELDVKHRQLDNLSKRMHSAHKPLGRLHELSTPYGLIKEIVDCEEYIKFLESDRKDLENKLNVDSKNNKQEMKPNHEREGKFEVGSKVKQSDDSLRYEIFCSVIKKYMVRKDIPDMWKKMFELVNLNHPVLMFQPYNQPESIFHFDLRKNQDQKLYLVALGLYLFTKNKPKEFELYRHVFHSFYPDNFPVKIENLSKFFGQQGNELYASLYRIEELMNYFARVESPKNNLLVDIDNILSQIANNPARVVIPQLPTPKQYSTKMFKQAGIGGKSVLLPRKLQLSAKTGSGLSDEYEIDDPYLTGGSAEPEATAKESDGWLFKR